MGNVKMNFLLDKQKDFCYYVSEEKMKEVENEDC